MSGPDPLFEARLVRRVHPGLEIDLTIGIGDEAAILFGPSGSGKSSILRMIAGLDPPDSGRVRLGDSTLFDSDQKIRVPLRARNIGMIDQDDLLFPHLNVEANVRFGLSGWARKEADARVAEVSELCEIGPLLGRKPGTLSGGERQRVGLARTLAPRPRLLLCDEPVSALDLEARHALVERLKVIRRETKVPLLYVTHAIDEAVSLGTRLFLLSQGRVEAEGNPIDVLAARSGASSPWPSLMNVFEARVIGLESGGRSSRVQLQGGPELVVAGPDVPIGTQLLISVRSDDIVLAPGPVGPVSARNLILGRVDRVVGHGHEAEVLVRTGDLTWVVGVVGGAVESLGLIPEREVRMIIKARSCRALRDASD